MGDGFDAASISQAELEIAMVIQAQVGYETKVQWAIAHELALREQMAEGARNGAERVRAMDLAVEYVNRVRQYYADKLYGMGPYVRRSLVMKTLALTPSVPQLDAHDKTPSYLRPKMPWYLPDLRQDLPNQNAERLLMVIGVVMGFMFLGSLIASLLLRFR